MEKCQNQPLISFPSKEEIKNKVPWKKVRVSQSFLSNPGKKERITIYAPMIYTAPCIMFWMRVYPLRGEV